MVDADRRKRDEAHRHRADHALAQGEPVEHQEGDEDGDRDDGQRPPDGARGFALGITDVVQRRDGHKEHEGDEQQLVKHRSTLSWPVYPPPAPFAPRASRASRVRVGLRMSRVHNRAPSTGITPLNTTQTQPNRRRGCNPVHTRPGLPRRKQLGSTITGTEGAQSCTLDRG